MYTAACKSPFARNISHIADKAAGHIVPRTSSTPAPMSLHGPGPALGFDTLTPEFVLCNPNPAACDESFGGESVESGRSICGSVHEVVLALWSM